MCVTVQCFGAVYALICKQPDINGNSYMESPTAPLHLTLGNLKLKGQTQGHPDFKALYPVNEPFYALCYY